MRNVRPVLAGLLLLTTACGQALTPGASGLPSSPPASAAPSATSAPASAAPSDTGPPASVAPAEGLTGQIAYVSGLDPQIFLLDLATGESRQLTQLLPEHGELTGTGPLQPALSCGFGATALAWSPDGRLLAFTYGSCDTVVYVVDLDGELRRIGDGRSPAWSPDGSQLLYAANVPYHPCGSGCGTRPTVGDWDLRIVDVADGSERRALREPGATEGASGPIWSPDGTQIAYAGAPSDDAPGDVFSAAYIIGVEGSSARFLDDGLNPVAWMPDGRLLASEHDGSMLALDLATGVTEPIAPPETHSVSPDATRTVAWAIDHETSEERAWLSEAGGRHLADLPGPAIAWTADSELLAVADTESGAIIVVHRDGAVLGGWSVDLSGGGLSVPGAWRPEG